jgi:hypothetical protein
MSAAPAAGAPVDGVCCWLQQQYPACCWLQQQRLCPPQVPGGGWCPDLWRPATLVWCVRRVTGCVTRVCGVAYRRDAFWASWRGAIKAAIAHLWLEEQQQQYACCGSAATAAAVAAAVSPVLVAPVRRVSGRCCGPDLCPLHCGMSPRGFDC